MPDNHLDLIVVVSGEETAVEVNVNQKADQIVREGLRESGNQGQAPDQWELTRAGDDSVIDQSARIRDLGLADGDKLFLNPRAGRGG